MAIRPQAPQARRRPAATEARLAALAEYGILDTPREPAYDDVVRLAAEICGTPMALITLVADDRQWFKAAVGIEERETELETSICATTIQGGDLLEVEDATLDPRFSGMRTIRGAPNVRYYAGACLTTPAGVAVGTVCVLDRVPRRLEPDRLDALRALARLVSAQLEARRQTLALSESLLRERAANARATWFARVVDSAYDGVCVVDTEGRVAVWNQGARRMFGWTAEEARGRHIYDLLSPPEHRVAAKAVLARVLAGEAVYVSEQPRVTRSGARRTMATSWSPLVAEGNVVGAVAIKHDVTAEVDRRRKAEGAREEFLSVASHELRTPLAALRGALGLLQGGLAETHPERAREMIRVALTSTDRLVRLSNGLLDLHRLRAGSELALVPIDASDAAREAWQGQRPLAETAGVRLEADLPSLPVRGSHDHLVQVFVNLLHNAIKFTAAGGRVRLAGRRQDAVVRLTVEDEGCGIPADELERIFEPFHQVDASDSRARGGSGLGLAVTREIVRAHRGRIWAESEPGRGTVVTVELGWREEA